MNNSVNQFVKLPFRTAFLFLISGTIAFAQDANSQTEQPAAVSTTPDTVAVEDVADDSKIARRLQGILETTGWFPEVSVESDNGFVIIQGKTNSDEHSQWAEEIATRTTDVIGVSNLLKVESSINFGEAMSVVGSSLNKLYRDFLLRLPFWIAGFIVIALTWIASLITSSIVSRLLNRQQRIRQGLKDLVSQLTTIAVWLVGILVATVIVFPGMTPAKALTVLGLGSVAIGFAFKDIFENFFAGVLILWRYPFDRGDFIQSGDILGKVEEITIRNTFVRRTDGELVVIPNAQIFKSNVEILTNRSKRRVRLICGVGYGEDVNKSRDVIFDAVNSCPSVDRENEVQVFAKEFGDSSVNFEIAWWTGPTPLEIRRSRDEVVTSVKSGLDQAGIEIPFPYRTLTFADPLKLYRDGDESALQASENNRD